MELAMTPWARIRPLVLGGILSQLAALPAAAHDGAHLGDGLAAWQVAIVVLLAVAGYVVFDRLRGRPGREADRKD
jgi:hypothetical protein